MDLVFYQEEIQRNIMFHTPAHKKITSTNQSFGKLPVLLSKGLDMEQETSTEVKKTILPYQEALMKHDPTTGKEKPYPSHARQYRFYHGSIAWLYNPWTGAKRDASDVGSDVLGYLIKSPNDALYTAKW